MNEWNKSKVYKLKKKEQKKVNKTDKCFVLDHYLCTWLWTHDWHETNDIHHYKWNDIIYNGNNEIKDDRNVYEFYIQMKFCTFLKLTFITFFFLHIVDSNEKIWKLVI
jgi:hypothetical protein